MNHVTHPNFALAIKKYRYRYRTWSDIDIEHNVSKNG